MASSAVTGERRWASGRSRRMTVLGKVAVPKPINLPSQRSENHGLDPNLEIVPEGTLSWGSRSSSISVASNAWGSSPLSASTDGGTSSPSHHSGRPSSGGSGTRPSTAGSDRGLESSAWGPNSRPSSASGALTSSQTSGASLRPHSAEPRPGSSQLSRFAEPSSDNSVAWGGSGTVEKLGGASLKNDGFSLASGDFPTLGSEKNTSGKGSQDGPHSRPGSSSRTAAPARDATDSGDVPVNANLKSEAANSWGKESSHYFEDGAVQPDVEKWQGGPQPYAGASVPGQHFDHWRGAPVGGPPAGMWFGAPPAGPPYGSPVPPGGFPMEPFPYYRPQVPAVPLANPPTGPPAASLPRGHHPNNGDLYRPTMPEAYIRPGMPIRPGFNHGPVTYEGYYSPPVGYCNPNERDIPFMGMAHGPPAYNRYPGQSIPGPGNPHTCFNGSSSTGKPIPTEQAVSVNAHDSRRPNDDLAEQRNGWDGRDREQKREHTVATNGPYFEKADHRKTSFPENDSRIAKEKNSRAPVAGEEFSTQITDNQAIRSFGPGKQTFQESLVTANTGDESGMQKLVTTTSSEAPQLHPNSKNSTLFQKIEDLNAKARASDGWRDTSSVSREEDKVNRFDGVRAKANLSKLDASSRFESSTGGVVSQVMGADSGEKNLVTGVPTGVAFTRRVNNDMQGRDDFRGKAKSGMQEVDGWRKKTSVSEPSNEDVAANIDISSSPHVQEKDEGESLTPMLDPSDCQRVKMRELAKQKAKQLQKEEEERTREQKAKALAKLEELNRRTQAAEGLTQKLGDVPSDGIHLKHGEHNNFMESATVSKSEASIITSVLKPDDAHATEIGIGTSGESVVSSRKLSPEAARNVLEEPVATHNRSLPSEQDVRVNDAVTKPAQQVGNTAPRQKRPSYKQKQNVIMEKNPEDTYISTIMTEELKNHDVAQVDVSESAEVARNDTTSSEMGLPIIPGANESVLHQRRKNNRGGKNKQKLEETSSTFAAPLPVSKEASPAVGSTKNAKMEHFESKADPTSSQLTESTDVVQSSEQQPLPGEEGHPRSSSQWRSQHSRRMPRNPQAVKEKFHGGDAVIWAPVRSQNKLEAGADVTQKTSVETASVSTKSEVPVRTNTNSKRAEMERYVPKPVANELAQHSSNHHSMSPRNWIASDEATTGGESGFQTTSVTQQATMAGKVSSSVEARNKPHKQVKAHGSWRQRASVDSTHMENPQDSSLQNLSKNVEKLNEPNQTLEPGVNLSEERPQYYDEWNPPDGWNIPVLPESVTSVTYPVIKDVGAVGRGKRHSFRGQRGSGNYSEFDHKNTNVGGKDKRDSQSLAPDMVHIDTGTGSTENRSVSERLTSHWQPKSQTNPAQNQRGNWPTGGQNVVIGVDNVIKDSAFQRGQPIRENIHRVECGQAAQESSVISEAPPARHQDARGERRAAAFKGRPHSPKQGPVRPIETAPSATSDIQHEQQSYTGFRKNGNQNSRYSRGQEPRGQWGSAGPDNRQHIPPASQERQKHPNYEYPPDGPQNNNRLNSSEVQADGSHRGRDRGQNHPRRGRGNFYARQSRRVDPVYD